MIYLPGSDDIATDGKYFSFDIEKKSQNFKIINNFVELSTVDPIRTIIEMLLLLNEMKEERTKKISNIEVKIYLLEKLLESLSTATITDSLKNQNIIKEQSDLIDKYIDYLESN